MLDHPAPTAEYVSLEIVGNTPQSEIWIADLEGCLVQKATGTLSTSLLRGALVVEFKLGGPCYPIDLQHPLSTSQAALEQSPACDRPVFVFEGRTRCPACKRVEKPRGIARVQTYRPGRQEVSVTLLGAQCAACGADWNLKSHHKENLRRLAARKPYYGRLLMTEEYLAFRSYYGLSVEQTAQLLSVTSGTYRAYEKEARYPTGATELLISLLAKYPHALEFVAGISAVKVPMWDTRLEDFRRISGNEAEKQKLLTEWGIALDFSKLVAV